MSRARLLFSLLAGIAQPSQLTETPSPKAPEPDPEPDAEPSSELVQVPWDRLEQVARLSQLEAECLEPELMRAKLEFYRGQSAAQAELVAIVREMASAMLGQMAEQQEQAKEELRRHAEGACVWCGNELRAQPSKTGWDAAGLVPDETQEPSAPASSSTEDNSEDSSEEPCAS